MEVINTHEELNGRVTLELDLNKEEANGLIGVGFNKILRDHFRLVDELEQDEYEPDEFEQDEWECNDCGYLNTNECDECDGCGTPVPNNPFKSVVDRLENFAEIANDEYSYYCLKLVDIYRLYNEHSAFDFMSDTFEASLCEEIKAQLKYFINNATVTESVEYKKIKRKSIKWK